MSDVKQLSEVLHELLVMQMFFTAQVLAPGGCNLAEAQVYGGFEGKN